MDPPTQVNAQGTTGEGRTSYGCTDTAIGVQGGGDPGENVPPCRRRSGCIRVKTPLASALKVTVCQRGAAEGAQSEEPAYSQASGLALHRHSCGIRGGEFEAGLTDIRRGTTRPAVEYQIVRGPIESNQRGALIAQWDLRGLAGWLPWPDCGCRWPRDAIPEGGKQAFGLPGTAGRP